MDISSIFEMIYYCRKKRVQVQKVYFISHSLSLFIYLNKKHLTHVYNSNSLCAEDIFSSNSLWLKWILGEFYFLYFYHKFYYYYYIFYKYIDRLVVLLLPI